MNEISFVKMHGAGNDFVMIDDRDDFIHEDWRSIAAIGSRATGIGCEGIIVVQKSEVADFKMRFFNPDGTEADLCGNGARCVAAFALEIGAASGKVMRFETRAGMVDAEVIDSRMVKVWMPNPKDLRTDFVNTGVPHRIVVTADLAKADVEGMGRSIRRSDEYAPEGTNVDFVTYRPPNRVSVRTYERGVEAETGACGTGAVAAAVVGVAQYGLEFPVMAKTSLGYELSIGGEFNGKEFTSITLTGPVKRVFEGKIDWDSLDIGEE